jgi:hypothetical protein
VETVTPKSRNSISKVSERLKEDITESDETLFSSITTTQLTDEQRRRLVTPTKVYPQQDAILAVHWHPEFIPLELVAQRIAATFPNSKKQLLIPTQHNEILTFEDYSGVEMDCYSKGFNQKVQLLLHFPKEALNRGDRLKSMLLHTFKYRSHQLYEYMETITRPIETRVEQAARETGSDRELIRFVRVNVKKIERLLDKHQNHLPPIMIKNKLLRNFFDGLRNVYGDEFIDRVQTFLRAVKIRVKAEFSLKYFYRTSQVIEEARALGAGIVIPHPEQFWPILLKDYDVDGIEVWNPQSRRYTEFLISVLNKRNKNAGSGGRKLITFMGDDTHMSEKARDPAQQNPEKARREVGLQSAWEDVAIRKSLIMAGVDRNTVIDMYRERLDA